MDATLDWDGDGPLEAAEKFAALGDALSDRLDDAAQNIGARIESDAASNAPVDSTQLQSSIEHVVEQVAEHVVEVRIGSNVEHAPHQEFGTVKMEAQPYLRPALEANRQFIVDQIESAVEQAFADAGFDV